MTRNTTLASSPTSPTPSNFDQAVDAMLKEGHGPREAIEAAATRWPELFERWQQELKDPYRFSK